MGNCYDAKEIAEAPVDEVFRSNRGETLMEGTRGVSKGRRRGEGESAREVPRADADWLINGGSCCKAGRWSLAAWKYLLFVWALMCLVGDCTRNEASLSSDEGAFRLDSARSYSPPEVRQSQPVARGSFSWLHEERRCRRCGCTSYPDPALNTREVDQCGHCHADLCDRCTRVNGRYLDAGASQQSMRGHWHLR